MAFAYILAVFFLAIGSPFPGQVWSSSLEHHRTKRGDESPVGCPSRGNWLKNNGNCYYFSSDQDNIPLASWTAAETACGGLLGTEGPQGIVAIGLAELGNPDNLKSDGWLMEQIKAKGNEVWLGASDLNNDDIWVWNYEVNTDITRELSLDDAYWGPNQPNNHKGQPQKCLSTIKEGDKTPQRQYFNDEKCTKEIHYVCQGFK